MWDGVYGDARWLVSDFLMLLLTYGCVQLFQGMKKPMNCETYQLIDFTDSSDQMLHHQIIFIDFLLNSFQLTHQQQYEKQLIAEQGTLPNPPPLPEKLHLFSQVQRQIKKFRKAHLLCNTILINFIVAIIHLIFNFVYYLAVLTPISDMKVLQNASNQRSMSYDNQQAIGVGIRALQRYSLKFTII